MLAQNERESVDSEVSSNSGRELAQINCRKEAHLLIGQRSRRRKQTKLPHHSNIVPIRKMLNDLAIEHPIHVDVLNLENATRGLHTHEHSAIDGKA